MGLLELEPLFLSVRITSERRDEHSARPLKLVFLELYYRNTDFQGGESEKKPREWKRIYRDPLGNPGEEAQNRLILRVENTLKAAIDSGSRVVLNPAAKAENSHFLMTNRTELPIPDVIDELKTLRQLVHQLQHRER